MSNWVVRLGGKPVGTFSTDDLRQAVKEGRIDRNSEIGSSDDGPWQSIARVKGLEWPKETAEATETPSIEAATEAPPLIPSPAREEYQKPQPTSEELLRDIALSLKILTDHDTRGSVTGSEFLVGGAMLAILFLTCLTPYEIRTQSLLAYIGFCITMSLIYQIYRAAPSPVVQYQKKMVQERKIKEKMERARAAGKAFQAYTKK